MKKIIRILSEDTLTAKLLERLLGAEGHMTCHEAHRRINPKVIQDACLESEADVIIFDLPRGINYAPLCRIFNEQAFKRETLRVTLSTSRRECESCPYVEQDAYRCFLKPFRIADIVSAINLKPAIRF